MNLQNILLLGNDMIIPRDIRDWGTAWITEPQVNYKLFSLDKEVPDISRILW